jgi:hypothetical protein
MGNTYRIHLASALAATVLLAGCNQPAPVPTQDSLTEAQIKALTERVETLERNAETDPTLKRSDTGYTIIDTDIGKLTFELKGITAEGSGSKVRLRIGNPTTATITEMTLYGHWGSLTKDGEKTSDAHSLGQPKITAKILPAGWSEVTFLIEGAKPADIGYLYITSALIGSINLYGTNSLSE